MAQRTRLSFYAVVDFVEGKVFASLACARVNVVAFHK